MEKLKDLGTPSAGSEFKVDFQWLQELNYHFTRHIGESRNRIWTPPMPGPSKKVNNKLQNKHWNCQAHPHGLSEEAHGREPCLCCWSGRRARLGLFSSAVPCPFLALRSSPHYKNRVLLASSVRVPRRPGLFPRPSTAQLLEGTWPTRAEYLSRCAVLSHNSHWALRRKKEKRSQDQKAKPALVL